MPRLSRQSRDTTPNYLHQLTQEARRIPGCLILTLGEPEYPPPPSIAQAVTDAAGKPEQARWTKYGPIAGLPELRQSVSSYMRRLWGVSYDPETEILITDGGKEALALAAYVACDPGQRIVTPRPYWPGYNGMEMLSRGSFTAVDLPFGSGVQALEAVIGGGTYVGAVLINSPNNPSGFLWKYPEVLIDLARRKDLWVISDDVYHSFVFDEKPYQPLCALDGAREHMVVVNSVSKTFSMTGFRVGWLAGPKIFIEKAVMAHGNLVTCVSPLMQAAAKRALDSSDEELSWLHDRVREYQRRRDILHDGLSPAWGPQERPEGTFFYWLRLPFKDMDARNFARRLIEEEKVAVAPGNEFGDSSHARLSLTIPIEQVHEVAHRLNRFAERYIR